ncbi:MAG: HU family DNA-binding protein [Bacteroidaceae bacterium]|nr:HU family DNA-binding protein [Prevotellaceae bacterium]MDY5631745.1 HU family DNA-binding protein [Bacteroidaceae bacterium]
MNKTELIAKVAEVAGLSKVDSKKAIEAAIEATKAALKAGEKVQIPGVITLSVAERAARTGKNPRTGEQIVIPAKKQVKIKAGSELEAAIK